MRPFWSCFTRPLYLPVLCIVELSSFGMMNGITPEKVGVPVAAKVDGEGKGVASEDAPPSATG